MKLSALIEALPPQTLAVASDMAVPDLTLTGLTADSRTVEPGNLFFALAGVKRGRRGAVCRRGRIQGRRGNCRRKRCAASWDQTCR